MRNAHHPDLPPDLAELVVSVASVAEPAVPQTALLPPWGLSASEERRYGKSVSVQTLTSLDDRFADLIDTVDGLRARAAADPGALDATEVSARMARLALRRIAFFSKAQELVEEAGERRATDVDAADFILIRAISLLKRVGKDLDELEPRIRELAESRGGLEAEINMISRLNDEVSSRKADAKRRMSE